MDTVRKSRRHIARESSESVYIWDKKRVGKAEIVGVGNSVE